MAYETTDELISEISDHWAKDHQSNMYKLLDSLNVPLEAISDQAEKVEAWRQLTEAQGTTLDLIGKDQNTYRINDDDNLFRFFIYLHKLLAHAQGTLPNLSDISHTALSLKSNIKVWQTGVNHIAISLPLSEFNDINAEKLLLDNLQQLVVLGVWLDALRWILESNRNNYIGATTLSDETYVLYAE